MTAVVPARPTPGSGPAVAAGDPIDELRRRLVIAAALALPVGVLSAVPAWQFPHWQWIALTLTAPVVVGSGWPFHRSAAEHLRHGTATVDTPVSIGTLAALGWSLHALLVGVPEAAPYLAVAAGGTVLALTGRYLGARTDGFGGPADRVATGYTALVLAVAVGALGFRLGTGGGASADAAAGVLILACTGAPGLATPAAQHLASGRAARLGVRAGWPAVLASIRHVDTVVLAGTGALTSGRMSLQAVYPAASVDPGEALRMAGAVGQDAGDPIGAELAAAARIAHGELPGVSEFDDLPGLGARGLVSELDGEIVRAHAVLLGRPALLAEHGVDLPDELATAVAAAHAEGVTAVVVAWDGTARAVLTLAATVRPGGAAAVARLRALGMRPVLVTRDEAAVAARIAVAVGIGAADVEAGTAPAAGIRALQADGRVVLVVGPGSTGAAALTMADLDLAVDAVRLARRTLSVIRWNLGLAVAPTAAALPVAVGGLLSPGIAGAALVVSALLVLINSGRLRWCGGGVRRAPGGWQESHLPATDSRESGFPANPASAPTPVER